VFTEMLSSFIVPDSPIPPDIPSPASVWLELQEVSLTGAGSIIVIDPSLWMPPGEMAAKVDRYADKVKGAKRRPGVEEIFLPGERGARRLREGGPVAILPAHWESFERIVVEEGLSLGQLRTEWGSDRVS
jgi:LDH2 family malate/lactate/ureidoglycolate dehydrogenase